MVIWLKSLILGCHVVRHRRIAGRVNHIIRQNRIFFLYFLILSDVPPEQQQQNYDGNSCDASSCTNACLCGGAESR
jgi:hypothetical protein